MMKKWLSAMLILAMLSTGLPGVLAESVDAPWEEAPELSLSEATGLELEPEGELPGEDEADETIESAAQTDARFTEGYAALKAEASLYASAEGDTVLGRLLKDGAVLVTGTTAHRYAVAFNLGGAMAEGFVAYDALEPLVGDDLERFLDALADEEAVLLYRDDLDRPLPVPVFIAEGVDAPEANLDGEAAEQSGEVGEGNEEDAPASEAPSVELSAAKLTIGVKEIYKALTAKALPAGAEQGFTWKSSNEKIVKVGADGAITGVKKGTATITCTAANGAKAACAVTVLNAPGKLTLDAKKLQLSAEGMVYGLVATLPKNTASAQMTFTSSDESVVSVSANGVLTTGKVGVATVTATTFNNKAAKVEVTVVEAPASVVFNVTELSLVEGQTQNARAKAYGADGNVTPASLTYEVDPASQDPDCVTVNPMTGAVTAVRKGQAAIRAVAHNGVGTEAACVVSVISAPAAIAVEPSLTLGVKETHEALSVTMTPPEGETDCVAVLAWSSSNAKIVKVDADTGALTALKAGTAVVTVKSHNGLAAKCSVTVKKAPKKIAVEPAAVTLSAGGDTAALTCTLTEGSASALTFTSSDTGVVTVDDSGLLTSVGKGTATVTVKTFNKKSATCRVTVVSVPDQVLLPEVMTVAEKQTVKLDAVCLDENGEKTASSCNYRVVSGDGEVSLDNDNKTLTGVAAGTVVIAVSTHNGVTSHLEDGARVETLCTVTVAEAPDRVELAPQKLTLGVGESATLTASVFGRDGNERTGDELAWSTSGKVVTVNQSGVVKGARKGTQKVKVSTFNGLSAECEVTVAKAPGKITLNATSGTLTAGDTYQLKATLPKGTASQLKYESSDEAVLTVDERGLITAVASGEATVTVSTFNGKKAICKVKVVAPPDQVFMPETMTLAEKQTVKLSATSIDAFGISVKTSYTFRVVEGEEHIALNERTGEITGVEEGVAVVAVTTANGVTTHGSEGERVETLCTVTVTEGPAAIELDVKEVTLGVGETLTLKALVTSKDGSPREGEALDWSAGGAAVEVENGVVQAVKAGTVTVTAKTFNGLTAACKVIVKKAPTSVKLTPASPRLGLEQTGQIKVTLSTGAAGSYTLSSSDESVATVDQDGVVTALKVGTTELTVKTYNNLSDTVTLTVSRPPEYLRLNGDAQLIQNGATGDYRTLYRKTLEKGKTFQIKASVEYGTLGDITGYASDDPEVAQVSETGLVTALQPGSATITVTATGGAKGTLRVTVVGNLDATLKFETDEIAVHAGQSILTPALVGSGVDVKRAALTVEDASVVKLGRNDEYDWELTGLAEGTTVLIATVDGVQARASVQVLPRVEKPAELCFEKRERTVAVGETFRLVALDEYGAPAEVELESADEDIVAVNEDGSLNAAAEGTAIVTAKSGELTAQIQINVVSAATQVTLQPDDLMLGVGDKASLTAKATGEGADYELTFTSSDPSVAAVSAKGVVVARGKGEATITAVAEGGAQASVSVTVYPAPSKVSIEPASVEAPLSDGGVQLQWAFGASDEEGSVSFATSDADVVTVDESGYVAFESVGSANITLTTYNGLTAVIPVTVLPDDTLTSSVKYRLFTACSFAQPGFTGTGTLPFPKNNANSVAKVFGGVKVGGASYTVSSTLINPSKAKLLGGISSFFAGADADDVSVVYLCSHGHKMGTYSSYRMSLAGYVDRNSSAEYYMTSQEIFDTISGIRGKVVLILDSCYSGTFIEDMKASLDAQRGRISVLTAAQDTRASFYNVKDTGKAVDFFTFFLLKGLGYNEREGWYNLGEGDEKGAAPGYMIADVRGNSDGVVTLGELYDYAEKSIATNIPNWYTKSWYWGDAQGRQRTRFYAGNNKELALYMAN